MKYHFISPKTDMKGEANYMCINYSDTVRSLMSSKSWCNYYFQVQYMLYEKALQI